MPPQSTRPTSSSSSASMLGSPAQKIRVTVIGARSLAKRDLFRLPDPFVRITVDAGGSAVAAGASPTAAASQWTSGGASCLGQTHCTETARNTVDPKWNAHYDLVLRREDAITISVWNEKKVHKGGGGGEPCHHGRRPRGSFQ